MTPGTNAIIVYDRRVLFRRRIQLFSLPAASDIIFHCLVVSRMLVRLYNAKRGCVRHETIIIHRSGVRSTQPMLAILILGQFAQSAVK